MEEHERALDYRVHQGFCMALKDAFNQTDLQKAVEKLVPLLNQPMAQMKIARSYSPQTGQPDKTQWVDCKAKISVWNGDFDNIGNDCKHYANSGILGVNHSCANWKNIPGLSKRTGNPRHAGLYLAFQDEPLSIILDAQLPNKETMIFTVAGEIYILQHTVFYEDGGGPIVLKRPLLPK